MCCFQQCIASFAAHHAVCVWSQVQAQRDPWRKSPSSKKTQTTKVLLRDVAPSSSSGEHLCQCGVWKGNRKLGWSDLMKGQEQQSFHGGLSCCTEASRDGTIGYWVQSLFVLGCLWSGGTLGTEMYGVILITRKLKTAWLVDLLLPTKALRLGSCSTQGFVVLCRRINLVWANNHRTIAERLQPTNAALPASFLPSSIFSGNT